VLLRVDANPPGSAHLPLRPQQRPHPEQCKDQPDPFHDRAAGDGQASDADDLRHRACQSEQ